LKEGEVLESFLKNPNISNALLELMNAATETGYSSAKNEAQMTITDCSSIEAAKNNSVQQKMEQILRM